VVDGRVEMRPNGCMIRQEGCSDLSPKTLVGWTCSPVGVSFRISDLAARLFRSLGLEPAMNFRAGGVTDENPSRRSRGPKAVAGPPPRARMKYGRIFAATRRAGAKFPHFVVTRRSKIVHIRRSSLLELGKFRSQRRSWEGS
jgi:hypothetical protein